MNSGKYPFAFDTPPPYLPSPKIGCPKEEEWTLIWCVLPVFGKKDTSAKCRNCFSTEYFVKDPFPFSSIIKDVGSLGLRPIEKSITPCCFSHCPHVKAIYFFSTSLFWNCLLIFEWAKSVFAITITPDVSLSNLWIIPGLKDWFPADNDLKWKRRPFTRVPDVLEIPEWTTKPEGLSITAISSSS